MSRRRAATFAFASSSVAAALIVIVFSTVNAFDAPAGAAQTSQAAGNQGLSTDAGLPPPAGAVRISFDGGTITQFEAALIQAHIQSVFIEADGRWLQFTPGAPSFVNRPFVDALGGEVPPGQALYAVLD